MRAVLLSAEYPPQQGGVGDYTRHLASALYARGVDVAVLTSVGAECPDDPPKVYPRLRNWGWGSLVAIGRFLRRHRPDVLHLQYQTGAYRMHPAIHFLPELLRLLPHPPRLIVTQHDLRLPYLFPKAGRLRHWVLAHLLRRADAVVVTNGADRARLQGEGAPLRDLLHPLPPGSLRHPPQLIPLGSSLPPVPPDYDRTAWRARLGLRPEQVLLGYFGLLHPSKGADLLVQALAGLRQAGRPAHLLLVGGGTGTTDPGNVAFQERVHDQIARLGLIEAVTWTGPCSAEQAAAHLSACDLIVLPFRDGASFRRSSLIAALALGCPVVTTQALSVDEIALGPGLLPLDDGGNVVLVPREDEDRLLEALVTLIESPSRLAQLSAAAARLGGVFCWTEVGRRTGEIYRQVTIHRRVR